VGGGYGFDMRLRTGPPEPSQRGTEEVLQGEIASLAPEWDELCDRLDVSPCLRPGWVSAWWEAFGSGELVVLTAHRGERLVGAMPLVQGGSGLASPSNWHSPEFGPVAEDEDAERSLIEDALSRAHGRLDLSFLRAEAPAVRLISEAARRRRGRLIVRTLERSPYVKLEGQWDDYEQRLPSKRRSDLRRRRRRLEELGSYEFECDDGSERLSGLLAEGFDVEAAGWEGRDGTAIAAQREARLFYERVAQWAAEGGYLRLFFVRLDRKPIAFAFCLIDSRSLSVLKIGFDPAFARFAPGLLLTREMLIYAFESGLHTYEFLGKAEPYKLIWSEHSRDRVRLQAFPRSAAGLASYLAWKHGRPIVRRALRR
jgi:CelD/BcsL family acetyltransferase involved in cellulose biosynthesis